MEGKRGITPDRLYIGDKISKTAVWQWHEIGLLVFAGGNKPY